jgi:hypothetical protein
MLHRESLIQKEERPKSWRIFRCCRLRPSDLSLRSPENQEEWTALQEGELPVNDSNESFLKDEIGKIVDIQEDLGLTCSFTESPKETIWWSILGNN